MAKKRIVGKHMTKAAGLVRSLRGRHATRALSTPRMYILIQKNDSAGRLDASGTELRATFDLHALSLAVG